MTPPRWQTWTGLGLVYVVWGSTYLAIRYVLESLPPLLTAGTRFLTAATLLGGFLLLRRRRTARPTARQVLGAVGIGLLLLLGGNGGVTLAEDAHLPSGLAALLVAAVPLWVVLLRTVARDRPTRGTLVGVAVGFVGLAVLLLPGCPADRGDRRPRAARAGQQPALGDRLGAHRADRPAGGPAGHHGGGDARRGGGLLDRRAC